MGVEQVGDGRGFTGVHRNAEGPIGVRLQPLLAKRLCEHGPNLVGGLRSHDQVGRATNLCDGSLSHHPASTDHAHPRADLLYLAEKMA